MHKYLSKTEKRYLCNEVALLIGKFCDGSNKDKDLGICSHRTKKKVKPTSAESWHQFLLEQSLKKLKKSKVERFVGRHYKAYRLSFSLGFSFFSSGLPSPVTPLEDDPTGFSFSAETCELKINNVRLYVSKMAFLPGLQNSVCCCPGFDFYWETFKAVRNLKILVVCFFHSSVACK